MIPVAPIRILFPFSGLYGFGMVSDVGTDLQKKADGVLTHDLGPVAGHIDHRDPFFPGVSIIHNVIAGRHDGDQPDPRASVHGLPGHRRLIGHHDLRIADLFCDLRRLLIRNPVIHRHLPKLFQRLPGQVSRIFRIAV